MDLEVGWERERETRFLFLPSSSGPPRNNGGGKVWSLGKFVDGV